MKTGHRHEGRLEERPSACEQAVTGFSIYLQLPRRPADQSLTAHNTAQVAGRLGVRSLRGQTLAESSDYMQLGVHAAEAFGQSEALTTRLRHIINDYADGPGILMELLQNADDAGATQVSFLLDEDSYGASSILGELLPSLTFLFVHVPCMDYWSPAVIGAHTVQLYSY